MAYRHSLLNLSLPSQEFVFPIFVIKPQCFQSVLKPCKKENMSTTHQHVRLVVPNVFTPWAGWAVSGPSVGWIQLVGWSDLAWYSRGPIWPWWWWATMLICLPRAGSNLVPIWTCRDVGGWGSRRQGQSSPYSDMWEGEEMGNIPAWSGHTAGWLGSDSTTQHWAKQGLIWLYRVSAPTLPNFLTHGSSRRSDAMTPEPRYVPLARNWAPLE